MVVGKLKKKEELSKQDMFALIDVSGNGLIDVSEYQRFLSRTGILLTEHKLLEIFTNIKVKKMEDLYFIGRLSFSGKCG
jgi:Ca2+-binding EF-hand superfamily protein